MRAKHGELSKKPPVYETGKHKVQPRKTNIASTILAFLIHQTYPFLQQTFQRDYWFYYYNLTPPLNHSNIGGKRRGEARVTKTGGKPDEGTGKNRNKSHDKTIITTLTTNMNANISGENKEQTLTQQTKNRGRGRRPDWRDWGGGRWKTRTGDDMKLHVAATGLTCERRGPKTRTKIGHQRACCDGFLWLGFCGWGRESKGG